MRKLITFSLIIFLLLSSCKSYKHVDVSDFTEAPLFGMVYGPDNRPLADVAITLNDIHVSTTDIEGRFIIPSVPKGQHIMISSKEGFETIISTLIFNNRTQVVHILMLSKYNLFELMISNLREGRLDKARETADRIIKIEPEDPEFLYLFAILEYLSGEKEEALKKLEQLKRKGIDSEYINHFLDKIKA